MSYVEHFQQTKKTEYKDASRLAFDHNTSILRPAVTEITCSGEKSRVVLTYESGKAQEVEGRAPKILDTPANRVARMLKYRPPIVSGEIVDHEDVFRGMSDFQSPTMQHHAANIARGIDGRILEGMFGDAYEGEVGGTVIPLPTGNVIPATKQSGAGTSATGMNLEKIKENRKRKALRKIDLGREMLFMAVTAEQIDDLSNEIELTSADYRAEAGPQFSRDGKLSMVWNTYLIEYQDLPTKLVDYGAGEQLVQRVPSWIKSTIYLGVWSDAKSDARPLPERVEAPLLMEFTARMDCRRIDEKGFDEIECLIG